MYQNQVIKEQKICLEYANKGLSRDQIAQATGLSLSAVKRRLSGARKRERLDPVIRNKLDAQGLTDLAGLHSGWLLEKDKTGSGSSLYFYLGPDQEKISFADAIKEILSDIPQLTPLVEMKHNPESEGFATWLMMADLHVGTEYGQDNIEEIVSQAVDDLVFRLPPAEKAVLIELGDLLDANDHKGLTPANQNPVDVIRHNSLTNTQTAIRILRRTAMRLAETHNEVEIHLIPGNHDPTAYIAVLLALEAQFQLYNNIHVVVTQDPYRIISWGSCAVFPHHGDKMKWENLKDVFADQFSDEWAAAKSFRLIATAHFHHDRRRDLLGCTAEHFRTLSRPSKWAVDKGFLSRGSLSALTVHRDRGEENRTISNIRPMYRAR